MVTAILPTMVSQRSETAERTKKLQASSHNTVTSSTNLDGTYTPTIINNQEESGSLDVRPIKPLSTRLAGLVGLFTGCGALLALSLFLPLPAFFQGKGFLPGVSIQYSFYVVGAVSLVVAIFCLFGLRNLDDKNEKSLHSARLSKRGSGASSHPCTSNKRTFIGSLFKSFALGYVHPEFCLSYVGGFVARASSVGVTLFIPLFVNAYYKNSGLCDERMPDIHNTKEHCRHAYIVAAKLTGVSQLAALIFAPIFGYLADRHGRFNIPLLTAAWTGILGYTAMTFLGSPDPHTASGTIWVFLIVSLLGISQIGAIVCSLGLLGHSILELTASPDESCQKGKFGENRSTPVHGFIHSSSDPLLAHRHTSSSTEGVDEESTLLLSIPESVPGSYEHLKGSIAGVYSLAGGAGILLLTKTGGVLFDRISPVAPFYLLALINGCLLLAGIVCTILMPHRND